MAQEVLEYKVLSDVQDALRDLTRFDSKLDDTATNAQQEAKKIVDAFDKVDAHKFKADFMSGFKSQFSEMGLLAKGGAADLQGAFASMAPSIGGFGNILSTLTPMLNPVAIGVTAIGTALIGGAMAATQMADELSDTANNLGVTTGFLQQMNGTALAAGGSAQAFQNSFAKMNQTVGDAVLGNEKANASFAALGVSVKNADGSVKSGQQIFEETRTALAGVASDTERAALAQDIFGKGSKELAGLLKMSTAEYEASRQAIRDYATASDESIQSAAGLTSSMEMIGNVAQAGIIDAFAPVAELLSDMANAAIPYLAAAFDALGVAIDVIVVVFRTLWDIFGTIIEIVYDVIANFTPLGQIIQWVARQASSTGSTFGSVMSGMQRAAAAMVGTVMSVFKRLSAYVHNAVAAMNNYVADSFLGSVLGVNKMAYRDAGAEGALAYKEGYDRVMGIGSNVFGGDRDGADPGSQAPSGRGAKGGGGKKGGAGKGKEKSQADKDAEKAAREAEAAQKKYNDALDDYATKTREASYSETQLAMVEGRRKAGLDTNLDVQNEQTKAVDAAALAYYRLIAAKKAVEQAEQTKKQVATEHANNELGELEQEAKLAELRGNATLAEQLRKQVQQERLALKIAEINADEKLDEGQKAILVSDEQRKANLEEQIALQQQQNDAVDTMAGFLSDLWDDPMATMKRFFADLMKKLLEAILRAALLGEKLGGGGGIGGLLKTAITSAIGFRANGGSVSANKPYIVGERGPELMVPGRAGQVLTNRKTSRLMGGGGGVTLAPVYHIQLSGDAAVNAQTLAQIKMSQAQQNAQIRSQANQRGWRG
ncbi:MULTISPECIES: hypothetical protein [unclassified Sphingopyxis]|uniref:hypothetical protein n=1 Tax=unclassified Sphingopyxis TaxID=2614943 RepID=UPI000730AAA4|nr:MULTISPECIES: hypothetical protein [unclassified Sphingopyxis]KTE27412.1 hypothetical protein ATE61_05565 [Sphingopyxis sp. H057]KTE54715.1 hypothetical protein ATE64_05560 [Sphingopyxis sp. H073]KTE57041.1 hypothetical protein ATE69_05545 [Sphingopyxis sp. H071]KTE60118.1 hypothetical protein ATE66_09565 [Sphingopyxis sp. H107]KTE67594.1 hypothetical protein ATE60_19185 [Sphingopyxis sp. H081]